MHYYSIGMIWSGNISPFPSPFVREAWLQGRNLKQPNTQGLKGNYFFFRQTNNRGKKKHDKEETDIIVEAERWAQLDTEGGRPGRRVWMIFGFGEVFGSSSSSMSLSHTCTTTLGVDSVPAWSSYFSPERQAKGGWLRGKGAQSRFFGNICSGSKNSLRCLGKPGSYPGMAGGVAKWSEIARSLYLYHLFTGQRRTVCSCSRSHSVLNCKLQHGPRDSPWDRGDDWVGLAASEFLVSLLFPITVANCWVTLANSFTSSPSPQGSL